MTDYSQPVDIANRALQHVGATRIDALTDDSKNAKAVNFVYDKVRRAELRRNVWRFAIKRAVLRPLDTDTMLLSPPAWDSTVYYQPGNIVSYGGLNWVTTTPFSIGDTPGTSAAWDAYFGPLTASLYDSTDSYDQGEIAYNQGAIAGITSAYISQDQGNTTDPTTPPAYDGAVTYKRGDIVTYSASDYISLIDLNNANTPASTYALWLAGTTYASTNKVITPDGRIWTSVGNGNIAHDPLLDTAGTYWTVASTIPFVQPWLSFSGGVHGLTWRYYAKTSKTSTFLTPRIIYPLGAGPSSNASTRNAFRLPNGFLRLAPQDPKAGSTSWLGGPTGVGYVDWNLEGDYLTTRNSDNIPLRFVADITQVTEMDDMFCEGLAARIAMEICEEITQSDTKFKQVSASYARFMSEARIVNGIETGATEPPEDDYITCRM